MFTWVDRPVPPQHEYLWRPECSAAQHDFPPRLRKVALPRLPRVRSLEVDAGRPHVLAFRYELDASDEGICADLQVRLTLSC